MRECYYHLDTYPDIAKKFIDEAQQVEYVFRGPPSHNVYRAETSFCETNFAKSLYKQFGELVSPANPKLTPGKSAMNIAYYKNDPKTGYVWHTDAKRSCAINIVMTDNPSALTMHREMIDHQFFNIEPVPYIKYRPFLFNTRVEHAVYNPDPTDRIILTIGFIGPSYDEVKDFLLSAPLPDPETW
jgi:hypothetical protein